MCETHAFHPSTWYFKIMGLQHRFTRQRIHEQKKLHWEAAAEITGRQQQRHARHTVR